jgi:RNA methyltransferase, TrmH family
MPKRPFRPASTSAARAPHAPFEARKPPASARTGERPTEDDDDTDGRRSELVHGARAALAIVRRRPREVRGAWATQEALQALPELAEVASRARVRIQRAADAELTRRVHTPNHEGVVLEVLERSWHAIGELADELVAAQGLCVVLDRVRNPHNIGAIARSAAFFGARALLLGSPAPHPGLPPDAVRIAEGGAEHLALARTTDLAGALDKLRARGVRVVGGESDVEAPLFGAPLRGPVAIVVGHEVEGISERVRARCDQMVTIPGTGVVGSLNVAISASLFMAEWARGREPLPALPNGVTGRRDGPAGAASHDLERGDRPRRGRR